MENKFKPRPIYCLFACVCYLWARLDRCWCVGLCLCTCRFAQTMKVMRVMTSLKKIQDLHILDLWKGIPEKKKVSLSKRQEKVYSVL